MGDIFYWVLNMSVSASIVGLVLLLLRSVKRIPRRFIFLFWAIPLIRMWCPVSPGGRYSLMSLISEFTTRTVTVNRKPHLTAVNHAMAAESYAPITYKVDLLEDVMRVGAVIWLAVVIILIVAFITVYFVTVRDIGDAEHIRDNLYVSDTVDGPMVCGVFKPRIILPSHETDRYVLLHERTHIKRLDNLWRIIGIVSACVHWFNPLCWLFLRLSMTDSELACDEAVIKRLHDSERKEYALTLLTYAEKKRVGVSAFAASGVKSRIGRIVSYRRLSLLSVIGFILLTVFITYFLLTNSV